jgi:broad specificity phosphatase PhoE
LLVRHGESTWNAERRWAGQADPVLTDRGRLQARELAERLADVDVDVIVSSDLRRAGETARVISQAWGGPNPIGDARLRERSSVWSGLTSAEIELTFPGQLEAWREGVLRELPAGSELWADFLTRVGDGVHAHLRPQQTVLAVTHAGVFRAIEALFDVPSRRVGNAHGQWLHLDRGSVRAGPRF